MVVSVVTKATMMVHGRLDFVFRIVIMHHFLAIQLLTNFSFPPGAKNLSTLKISND